MNISREWRGGCLAGLQLRWQALQLLSLLGGPVQTHAADGFLAVHHRALQHATRRSDRECLQAAGRFYCQPRLKQMTSGGKQMTSGGKQATLSQNSSGTPASWVRAGEDQSAICTRDAEADAEACESHTGCQTGDLIQTPLYSSRLTTSYPISSNFWLWIALQLVAELHTSATFPCGICHSSAVTAQWR